MTRRNYECMFVLNSGKYASDPSGAEANLKELFDRVAAEIVVQSPWQDGKLAYPINGHRKGTHYLVYFRMDGSQMNEFVRLCKLNDLILRHMVLEHSELLFDAILQQMRGESPVHGDAESTEHEPANA